MALRSSLEVSLWKLASSRLRRGHEILAALAGSAPGHGLPAPRLCAATITSVRSPPQLSKMPRLQASSAQGEVDGSGRAGPAIGGGRERGRRGGAGMVARGRVGVAEQGRRQE
ncbi:hypothetical protein U9M48_020709 [Paspalum notatum var. saurae]|uniref:Uncharacterized protein n=1 Tax=Paspalum notatum var. saurae TaxID=547442 RepID=A0AAQ3TFP0_PASNO